MAPPPPLKPPFGPPCPPLRSFLFRYASGGRVRPGANRLCPIGAGQPRRLRRVNRISTTLRCVTMLVFKPGHEMDLNKFI